MSKIKQLKTELKLQAKSLSSMKRYTRSYASHRDRGLELPVYPKDETSHWIDAWTWRHRHIAYCLLRGTPYEMIEPKVLEGNEPNWDLIKRIQAQYTETTEEIPIAQEA